QQTLLYDPYEENLKLMQAAPQLPRTAKLPDKFTYPSDIRGVSATGQFVPARLPSTFPIQDKEKEKEKESVPPKKAGTWELTSPRSPVTVSPLREFGRVIITANNQSDLELVMKIIEELQRQLREEADTGLKLELVPLENADCVEVAAMINNLQ